MAYGEGKNTILKIVLKVKDEILFFQKWYEYHKNIVGPENIVIVNCGSINCEFLKQLENASSGSLVINYDQYFNNIHSVSANREFYDLLASNCKFLTILDCDEFLFEFNGEYLFDFNICNYLYSSNEKVICACWVDIANQIHLTENGLVFDDDIFINVSVESIYSGFIHGKAIINSNYINAIETIMHCLHENQFAKLASINSFGRLFLLHLRDANDFLIKVRALTHLRSPKSIPVELINFDDIANFLNRVNFNEIFGNRSVGEFGVVPLADQCNYYKKQFLLELNSRKFGENDLEELPIFSHSQKKASNFISNLKLALEKIAQN